MSTIHSGNDAVPELARLIVATAEQVDAELREISDRFEFPDCVFTVAAASFNVSAGEDLAPAARQWVDSQSNSASVTIRPGSRPSDSEIVRFFQSFSKSTNQEALDAIHHALMPLLDALKRIPEGVVWHHLVVPTMLPSGAWWDVCSDDFAFTVEGTVTFVHLGWSD